MTRQPDKKLAEDIAEALTFLETGRYWTDEEKSAFAKLWKSKVKIARQLITDLRLVQQEGLEGAK